MKICIVFNHPAPYKVRLFNELAKKHDIFVVFERKASSGRAKNFYNEEIHFPHIFLKGINVGEENFISNGIKTHLKQNKYEVAYGIINNSLIQLEKNNTSSEYLLMLFKYNMYKVMMFKKQYDIADICINHAKYIAAKYGIMFNFDTNAEHYATVEQDQMAFDSVEDNLNDVQCEDNSKNSVVEESEE